MSSQNAEIPKLETRSQFLECMFQLKLSAAVRIFLDKIDHLSRYREKTYHERLEIQLPPGLLHWQSTAAFPDKSWGSAEFRLCTTGTEILCTIGFAEQSHTSSLKVIELFWSIDEARTVYALEGVVLSIEDMRSLIGYLLATFYACSVSVSANE